MVRLFVAIDLPTDIRERLKVPQEHLKKSTARLNPVDPALIHITLKFIGEVPQDAIGKIIGVLSGVSFSPFDLRVTGIGSNNPRQPRVIWCTIEDGGGSAALHAKVEDVLSTVGIARDDRPFRPHATIARVKQGDPTLPGWIRAIPPGDFGTCTVNRFRLKKSTLTPGGPIYETILEVPTS
ncbi:MAG: RNA 2',3'-cyclic phosphodiesterase [Methanoregulaceae archaeon]|jgi:2'-5' RNA ligase|nr:RNA 2',3'-cyclic phosphodiesterase [Methanoregulaceae archaeon]